MEKESSLGFALANNDDETQVKPQIYFLDKVDNSMSSFVPKLKIKHFAQNPKDSLLEQAQKDSKTFLSEHKNHTFSNPYDAEIDSLPMLESLQKPPAKFDKNRQRKLLIKEVNQVDTPEELTKMIEVLQNESELAIDLEHHSQRSFQGFTCLMQVSSRDQDFLVDCIKLRSDMQQFNLLTSNPSILKVFHGCTHDIDWLQKDFGIYVVNLIDTFKISKRLTNLRSRSLGSLLYEFCDVLVDKSLQNCDWRLRPLTRSHIEYAASDTHYLLNLKDILLFELYQQSQKNGESYQDIMNQVYHECKMLSRKSYRKPVTFGRHFDILRNEVIMMVGSDSNFGVKLFDFLWEKRDDLARKYDESLNYVLSNRNILDLVQGRRSFESKVRRIQNKNNLRFIEVILEDYAKLKNKFWNETEDKIVEESVEKNDFNQEARNNANNIGVGGGRRQFAESNNEESQKMVDRSLKTIFGMKIQFKVNIQKEARSQKNETKKCFADRLFYGVDRSQWKENEETLEGGTAEPISIERPEADDTLGKGDFIDFEENTHEKQKIKAKKMKKQQLIDQIESVNLPENLKLRLMKGIVGRVSLNWNIDANVRKGR